jgi:hypothetical protein
MPFPTIRIVTGIGAGAGISLHMLQRVLSGLLLSFKNRLRPEAGLVARKILASATTPRSQYR